MTLHERREQELSTLRSLTDAAENFRKQIERTIGRIYLLDELIKEQEAGVPPDGEDAETPR